MEAENEDFYHDFEPTSMNHHQYYDDNIFQMENMFPLGEWLFINFRCNITPLQRAI